MKITFPENLYDSFEGLEIGEVFRFDGSIYMKTCTLSTSEKLIANAVNLETGCFRLIDETPEVERIHGEYIIK